MRLQKYIEQSCNDKDINKFRMLNVDFCQESDDDNKKIVEEIEKRFDVKRSILKEIEDYNKKIKRMYDNKYMFQITNSDFCIKESKPSIKKIHLYLNDRLSSIKTEIEKKLSEK